MNARNIACMIAAAAVVAALGLLVSFGADSPSSPNLARVDYPYENIGLGGGGGMYTPAISPVDPRLMFMSCDMGGLYRSVDGGSTWRFVHFRQFQGANFTKALFDPANVNVIYDYGGPWGAWVLMVSRDSGVTWKRLVTPEPWAGEKITALGIDRRDPRFLLVGTERSAWRSTDAGKTWASCRGVGGKIVGFHVPATGPSGNSRVVFAASEADLWRSNDSGAAWSSKTKGIEGDKLTGFCGGDDPAAQKSVLFVTMQSKAVKGAFTGGVFRSDDLGESWRSCMTADSGLNTRLGKVDEWGSGDIAQYYDVVMPRNQTSVVYVPCEGTGYHPPYHNTVYKSTDSGRTWNYVFNSDPRYPDFNCDAGWLKYDLGWGNDIASGLDVCDADPDVLLRTENGATFVTHDGGKSWQASYTRLAPGQKGPGKNAAWQSTGMEVTTNWNYFFDPFDHKKQYICYTDIGFARSLDGGDSWSHSAEGSPWSNTWYDMVFDPDTPGVIYAAVSSVHDIPHSTYTGEDRGKGPGGVCISTDFGKTWTASKGLPETPVTSICIDPKSPRGNRILYVTSWGLGVFKSTDSGKTWVNKSKGLAHPQNMRALLVRRAPSGNLYCAVGPLRVGSNFPTPGGIWKSTDGAESWTPINAQLKLGWQTGFAVDPTNENVIYSCAASGWSNRQGGVYKTTDAGKTWKQVFRDGSAGFPPDEIQAMFITMHPDDPKTLYLGDDGHGLFISKDAGETWRLVEGIPFASVHRVTFDPDDHSKIVVTTFGGGVCRGPAEGK